MVGRLPNLVIAGVTKAGTTSLFNYLGQHPDIGTSDVKELRYFMPLLRGGSLDPLESYMGHFTGTETVAMEATPSYFYGGGEVARALRDTCPGVRVVLSLRAPEERCWSWFRFVKARLRIPEDMTFDEYLDRCEDLNRAGVDGDPENQAFWGLGGGMYARWLGEWIEELGENLRIVYFDDLERDPRLVVTSLCEWIGLDTAPVSGFQFRIENKTEHFRHRRLQKAAVVVNRRSETFFRRHPTLKRALRRGYYAVNRAPSDTLLPTQLARLSTFYGPHNAMLAEQLARVGLSLPESWPSGGREIAPGG